MHTLNRLTLLASALLFVSLPEASASEGQSVYQANCETCHGASGDGNGPAAVALRPKPTDFTNAAWWEGKNDAALKTAIRAGRPGTSMSGFNQLSDAQINALVDYLKTLKP